MKKELIARIFSACAFAYVLTGIIFGAFDLKPPGEQMFQFFCALMLFFPLFYLSEKIEWRREKGRLQKQFVRITGNMERCVRAQKLDEALRGLQEKYFAAALSDDDYLELCETAQRYMDRMRAIWLGEAEASDNELDEIQKFVGSEYVPQH